MMEASPFPLYDSIMNEVTEPVTSIEASKLASKLRALRGVCDKDPSKIDEIKHELELMVAGYYRYYHLKHGVIPDSPLKVPYLGKICSKNIGIVTSVTDTFPMELLVFIDRYVNKLLQSS